MNKRPNATALDADYRRQFLMHVYDQMFTDINTHILVVWQSVGFLVGAIAALALAETAILPIDIGYALIVLMTAWLLAHLHDCAYWYNRNLAIIANIERQFLTPNDLKHVHYYFGKHRRSNAMLTHLKIQYYFGAALALLALIYHFVKRVAPGIGAPWGNFELPRALPYIVAVAAAFYVLLFAHRCKNKYDEFLKQSPGLDVDTSAIEYGHGHPI